MPAESICADRRRAVTQTTACRHVIQTFKQASRAPFQPANGAVTELGVGIRINVPGIEVDKPGSALLPIVRVGPILRESSNDSKLLVETNQQGTVIKGERSEFKLPAENPEEFPSVATFTDGKYHE